MKVLIVTNCSQPEGPTIFGVYQDEYGLDEIKQDIMAAYGLTIDEVEDNYEFEYHELRL